MDAVILLGSFIALILLGMPVAYALGMSALIGAWWLRRYRFGPVEWLWRSCMYGVPQPMRQRAV